ncbi:hypothetical protein PDESU_00517 [Pontiella desulfatans]|uniref:CBM-cenC domain-containing protein n=2 Tax=Pontiella desulfatans TaxID=2750659 RepID=A0A6C2TWH9_PONDE|nr:hypothetical protein PDESU_00517 [Pontiella desulfatans]
MRMSGVGLAVLVVGVTAVSYGAVVSNLVADAGFETSTVWSYPNADTAPWFSTGEGNQAGWVSRELVIVKSGAQGLKFSTWAGNAAALQNLGVTLDSNTVYEISFAMRLDNLSTNPSQTNATIIGVALGSSPVLGGAYSWTGKSFYELAPSTTGVWETITLTVDGSDAALVDNHGEYLQLTLKKFNNAKNSEYEVFVDDVVFGEYTTGPPPADLLLGFYGSRLANPDFHAPGIGGSLYTSTADGIGVDTTAGSSDGTYGTFSGATILPTGYKVHMGTTNKNQRVDVQILNNTGSPLRLDSVSFDYGRWLAAGPQDVALAYAYGDLSGIANEDVLFTATNLAVTGSSGDYHDFDISLSNLTDRVLADGEKATFRLSIDNAVGPWDKGAFDNIAIFGEVINASYETWVTDYPSMSGSPDADPDHDFDGDGWDNLMEYALGGNPVNGFINGHIPVYANIGSVLEYVYAMRTDDAALTYRIEVSDDLVSSTWTNSGTMVMTTNVTGGSFDFVTNSIPIDEIRKFARLVVEQ